MQDNPRRGILLMVATTIIFAIQDGISRYLAGFMTSLPLWPFAIGFLRYLFVRSAPVNQVDSNKPPPPANHGCKLAAVYFWPRKYVSPFMALAKLGWFNFMLFLLVILLW